MVRQAVQNILPEIVERLVEALSPQMIYLFGSQASGEARPDSDIDLLVVVAASDRPGHVSDREAYHALWGVRWPVEVLVWTREEFERGLNVRTSLSSTVKRTGLVLYAA